MWLMNATTLNLEPFGNDVPAYAILSHTWGSNEASFQDVQALRRRRPISAKIDGCCRQALKDGYNYVWIDTCCIDKTSSSELSEAINSMYSWYARAAVCYIYLSDVPPSSRPIPDDHYAFGKTRWFTRGWTLQELIAPELLEFYDSSWGLLGCIAKGTRKDQKGGSALHHVVADITRIPVEYIRHDKPITSASVAQKMSWASKRQTTRAEDVAYSLLGIFGVTIHMSYGEGEEAFHRLQEEIIRNVDDQSIFAWGYGSTGSYGTSCLARSPKDFEHCGQMQSYRVHGLKPRHYSSTNIGLHIDISLVKLVSGDYIGRLSCSDSSNPSSKCLAIPLILQYEEADDVFFRPATVPPYEVSSSIFSGSHPRKIYLSKRHPSFSEWKSGIRLSDKFAKEVAVKEIYPPNWALRKGLVYTSSGKPDSGKQTIFLACWGKQNAGSVSFIIKLVYHFKPPGSDGSLALQARGATLSAAPVYSFTSLPEYLVPGAKSLNWHEDFVFCQQEGFSFDGWCFGDYSRKISLDKSGSEWKIDFVQTGEDVPGSSY